jgi:hypothetical protein
MEKLKVFGSGVLAGAVMFGLPLVGYWMKFGFV